MSRMLRTVVVSSSLLVLWGLAGCQSGPPQVVTLDPTGLVTPRTIEVSGFAECNTAPDEFIVSMGVQTFHKELATAKADNDGRMKKLLESFKQYGVEARDVQTGDFRIAPREEGPYEARVLVGYDVHKGLTVRLRDPKVVEDVLQMVFSHGANLLYGVTFQSSQAIEKRKEARLLAVKAARAKAEAMAGELGQHVGRPILIRENEGFGGGQANFAYDNDSRADVTDTMATGKIPISANVMVTFELVD